MEKREGKKREVEFPESFASKQSDLTPTLQCLSKCLGVSTLDVFEYR